MQLLAVLYCAMKNVSRREMFLWIVVAILTTLTTVMAFNLAGGWPTLNGLFTPALPIMPVLAAGVATLSLLWAAFSTRQGWRRSKRQATIEAWAKWSEATSKDRILVTKHLGAEAISQDQGKALAHKGTLVGINGEVSSEDRNALANAVVRILNGLERLSVGVEQGVYDGTTVEELGATTIIRQYERFEEYIHARRNEGKQKLRQSRVFVELEALSNSMQGRKHDRERIKALKK